MELQKRQETLMNEITQLKEQREMFQMQIERATNSVKQLEGQLLITTGKVKMIEELIAEEAKKKHDDKTKKEDKGKKAYPAKSN